MAIFSPGQRLTSDLLNSIPQGLVYQGNRSSVSSTSSGTVELSIMRIDNMVLRAGYAYFVTVGNFRATIATPGANFKVALKYSSAGAATTSSTEIGRAEINPAITTQSWVPPTGWIMPASATTTASVLLSVLRTNSVAASTFTTIADTGGLWLNVIEAGIAVADTGIDL